MTTMSNFWRRVTLAIIGMCGALALSACGTAGSGFSATDYGVTGPLTVEQSAVSHTRNYMVDTLVGYNADGHRRPARPLTADESILVAEADMYCATKVQGVEGLAMEYLTNGVAFTAIGAVAQAAGSLGVPGADLTSYASLGAGGFGGSSIATTRLMIRQTLVILHSSCMQAEVKSDPRGRYLGIYPLIMGRAIRPAATNVRSPISEEMLNGDTTEAADEDVGQQMPFVPTPM